MASNKQQVQWTEFEEIHRNFGSLETSNKHVRIPPNSKYSYRKEKCADRPI